MLGARISNDHISLAISMTYYLEKLSLLKHGWWARHSDVTMAWNDGIVEARHHHVHIVFPAQHTNAIKFFLRLYYYFIKHCVVKNFSG